MKTMATTWAWILGVVFLLVGILGFFANPLVGTDALFETDLAHNLVHLLSGLVFVIVAMTGHQAAVTFMYIFGVVYLLVAILGFAMIGDAAEVDLLGLIHVNAADNWLHVVLGVVILGLGMYTGKQKTV